MAAYRVGLTGGVAAGKSSVARLFAALGTHVVDADIAARETVAPGTAGLADIVSVFGPEVLDGDGGLDRAAMRARVFADDAARRQLESLLHPRIRLALEVASADAPGTYVLVAIPLLAEGGGRDRYPWLDRILVVDAALAVQRERLLQRDPMGDVLADRMLAAQTSRHARLAIADDVLVNDGTLDDLVPHVAALDRQYRALAAQRESRS